MDTEAEAEAEAKAESKESKVADQDEAKPVETKWFILLFITHLFLLYTHTHANVFL